MRSHNPEIVSVRLIDEYNECHDILIVITTKRDGTYAANLASQFIEGIINRREDTLIASQGSHSVRFLVTDDMVAKIGEMAAVRSISLLDKDSPLNTPHGPLNMSDRQTLLR